MGLGQVLKKIDAFPKIIDIEVNKTYSGAFRKDSQQLRPHHQKLIILLLFSDRRIVYFNDIPGLVGAECLPNTTTS